MGTPYSFDNDRPTANDLLGALAQMLDEFTDLDLLSRLALDPRLVLRGVLLLSTLGCRP
jgi:hypothetical protein